MLNLYLADLYKMRKSAAMKILFGIAAVCAAAVPVMAFLISQGKLSRGLSGINFLLSDASMVNILGAVIAGIFICGDFDNRSIHEAVANGSSRFSVVLGKAAFFITAMLIIMLPYAAATLIGLGTGAGFSMGSSSVGFIHLLTAKGGKALTASETGKLIAVLITLAVVYTAQKSVCLLFAMAVKKPVVVVALSYTLAIFTAQLQMLKSSSKVFARIFACTPFGSNYSLLTLSASAQDLAKAVAVSVIFTGVMVLLTYLTFRKSEIR